LLGGADARLQGGGQGGAEQGAAAVKGEALAGIQDGASGGIQGKLAQVGDVGKGLFQGQPLVLVPVFNRQRRHR
jgi:hypothetical protein